MKKLIDYIKDFVRQDYNFITYLSVLLSLGIVIFLNYYFSIEKVFINGQNNTLLKFLLYLSLYSFAYYGVLGLYLMIKKVNYFSDRSVLVKSFLALNVVAFDRAFFISPERFQNTLYSRISIEESEYLVRIVNLVIPWFFYFFLFFLLKRKYDQDSNSVYGLSFRRFDWKPYIYMIFCMIPLLLAASFTEDFTTQYPFFKYWKYSPVFGMTSGQLFSVYEFFYLANFINIELLFRGLLVIGMVRYMGKDVILPMVVTYAFIHFGKPCAETISSVLGGYILGIFAYRTENIMGGIFIHISIAFLMDLFAIGIIGILR